MFRNSRTPTAWNIIVNIEHQFVDSTFVPGTWSTMEKLVCIDFGQTRPEGRCTSSNAASAAFSEEPFRIDQQILFLHNPICLKCGERGYQHIFQAIQIRQ